MNAHRRSLESVGPQVCQRREEVYVEGQLVGGRTRSNLRTAYQQRRVSALFVGPPLPVEYAMLAHLEAVVRGEEDVGVLQRNGAIGRGLLERIDDPLNQIVQRLQGFGPIFLTGVY